MTAPLVFLNGRVAMYVADVRVALDAMESNSVDMVMSSPPYWGLRDYGVDGQIGLEPTLGEHLDVMVDVFERVRRVLKPEGTLWINYGDCYATAPNGRSAAATKAAGADDRTFRDKPFSTVGPIYQQDVSARQMSRRGRSGNLGNGGTNGVGIPAGRVVAVGHLKPKDLCMVPNRLAIALQEAGWWVRSEIIWGKPNAMPDSSGVARPATAHEKVFLLAKSDAVRLWRARDTGELSTCPDLSEQVAMVTTGALGPRWIGQGHYYDAAEVRVPRLTRDDPKAPDGWSTEPGAHGSFHRGGREKGKQKTDKQRGHGRRHVGFNDRWDAMSKEEQRANGRLLRNYEPAPLDVWDIPVSGFTDAHFATFPPELAARAIRAGCPKGGLVLDPFGGAGTTALVALRLGRRAALVEISETYAAMARTRIERDWRQAPPAPRRAPAATAPLFDGLEAAE